MADTERVRELDASAPLDVAEYLRRVPVGATIKGLFLQRAVDEAQRHGGQLIRTSKYLPFKDYRLVEWMELLVDAATVAYPRLSLREALRKMGHVTFETFGASMLGRVMLTVTGQSIEATIPLVPKIYALATNGGTTAEIRFNEPGHVVVALRGAWDFADAYHVGVLEGGFISLHRAVETRIRAHTPERVDFEFRYR